MVTRMLAVLLLVAVSFSSSQRAGQDPTIKFERARESVTEESIYCFHLIAVGVFEDNFAVRVRLCPLTASHITDYSFPPPDFSDTTYANFTVGQINSTVVCIVLVNNNAWEPLELFQIKIEIPSGVKAMKGSPSTLTINIIDDDEVRVSFGTNSVQVAEDIGQLELKLQADGIYTTPFSVSVRCLEVNPKEAEVTNSLMNISDAYPESFRIEFEDVGRANTTSSELQIEIVDDLITEPTESFICLILRPFGTSGIVVTDPDTVTISILDNDILEVSFTERTYTGVEGATVDVRLEASGIFVQQFQARIFSSSFPRVHHLKDCEADEGEDYTSPSDQGLNRGLVDFKPILGSLSTQLFIPLVPDRIVECASECFRLNFVFEEDFRNLSPLELKVGSPSSATVCIQDKDMMFLRFEDTSYSVREDAGSVTIRLEAVQEDPDNPGSYVPAKYTAVCEVTCRTVAGSAEAGSDYVRKRDEVVFSDGMQFSTPFSVDIVDNEVSECPEEFTVLCNISSDCSDRVKFLDSNSTTVSITDDEESEISFTINTVEVTEGDTDIELVVMSDREFQENQRIRCSSNDGTTQGSSDYMLNTATSQLAAGQLTFSPPISVTIVDNAASECPEMFTVRCTLPGRITSCGGIEGDNTTVEFTIQDDDRSRISFTVGSMDVTEGTPNVQLTITSSNAFQDDQMVTVTATDGTAKDPSDYVLATTTTTLMAGETTFAPRINVLITDDAISECPEMFTVNLVLPPDIVSCGGTDGSFENVNITILDDDQSAISFTMDSVTVSEGGDPSFELTIRSNRAFQDNQMVMITAQNGTAEVPSDFVLRTSMSVLTAGSLTFAPKVAVDITNDAIVENVERFMVGLVLPAQIMTCGGQNGENTTVNATVLDDDSVFIRVKDGLYEVDEDGGSISFQLEVYNGTVFFPFNVNVEPRETSPVSATDKDDFEADVTVAMFPLGSTESTFARTNIIEDEVSECDETFQVEFSLPSNLDRVVLLEPSTIDVVIKENDDVKLMFNKGTETITEDPSLPVLEFYIDTDREFERDQQFTIVAEDGTAMSGTDFTLLTPSVTIEAGKQRSDVIRVRIEDDVIVEDVEMFKLRFELNQELMDCRVELAEPSVVDITIEDDDPVFLALALKRIPREIIEGNGSAIIQIEVQNGTIFFPINISIDVRELTTGENFATEFVDFYVFGDENEARLERFDNVSSTAEIRTVDNLICEMPELFEIEISINQPRVKLLEPTRLNLTIIDDDISDPDVDCFPPAVVSFNSDALYVVERGRRYSLPVYRVGKLEKPLVLNVTTEDLTTTKGVDYMLEDESIMFVNIKDEFEEIDINFSVPQGDGLEPREAFRIDLSVPDGLLTRQIDVTVIIEDKN